MVDYLILFASTWLLSQTTKYLILVFKVKRITIKEFLHTYIYASGIPSSHAAVLTSTLLFITETVGLDNPITFIATSFSLLWIYEVFIQRKRYKVLERIVSSSKAKKEELALLKDLNGHDAIDIFLGIVLGIVVYVLFSRIFF